MLLSGLFRYDLLMERTNLAKMENVSEFAFDFKRCFIE